MEERVIMWV